MATPTLVQHVSHSQAHNAVGGSTVTTYQVRFPNKTLLNNCVIVGISAAGSSAAPSSVVDDAPGGSNTYTQAGTGQAGSGQIVRIYIASGVKAGAQNITITYAGATDFVSAMASEFYNIATASPLDTVSAGANPQKGTGSSTSIQAGSFTPSTSGDLLWQYGVQDSTSNPITSFTQGSSPWALLSADVMDSSVCQFQVQASAASINPTLTMSPTNDWTTMCVALKSAAAGTAPTGMYVQRLQHNSIPNNSVLTSPYALQFPSSGNLIVASWIGVATHDITSLTDSKSNTYTQIGTAFGNSDSGDNQIFYATNMTPDTKMTYTLTTQNADISGSTLQLFDIAGADPSSPYDSTAGRPTASGTQSGGAGTITGCSITPSTANGIVISSLGVASNTINAVSGTGTLFLSSADTPETSPWPNDQNNGWATVPKAAASSVTFTWTSTGGAAGNWASLAAAFKAPASAAVSSFSVQSMDSVVWY